MKPEQLLKQVTPQRLGDRRGLKVKSFLCGLPHSAVLDQSGGFHDEQTEEWGQENESVVVILCPKSVSVGFMAGRVRFLPAKNGR